MLYDGISISEGGNIDNATIASGTSFPSNPSTGELFFRTDVPNVGLNVYDGTQWQVVGGTVDFDSFNVKQAVRAATTANITLSGTQTVDDVALVAGDRVLVKNQSTPSQNGIYVVSSSTWSRASDFDGSPSNEVKAGDFTFVTEGTTNADTGWVLSTNGTITIGTTALTFAQFTGASAAPGGSSGQIQYNDAGAFQGSSSLTWTNGTSTLTLGTLDTNASLTAFDLAIGQPGAGAASSLTVRAGNGGSTSNTTGGSLFLSSGSPGNAGAVSPGTAGHIYIEGATGGTNGIGATGGGNVFIMGGKAGSNTAPSGASNNGNWGYISFQTAPRNSGAWDRTERLRITRDGDWLIGGTAGTAGQVLTTAGAGTPPTWADVPNMSVAKLYVTAATTTNITLSGGQTVDGVSVGLGDRVLVKNQTNTTENGIWVGAVGAWTRATDFDSASEVNGGMVTVRTGNTQAGTIWLQTAQITTVGSQSMVFQKLYSTAADPTSALEVANKQYVDNSQRMKFYVDAASTANVNMTSGQTLDGVAVGLGNRVLVKNQNTPSENGVYFVQVGAWARMADFDAANEVNGAIVVVKGGNTQAGTMWLQSAAITTVGTDAMVFQQLGGSGAVSAGSLTGTTLASNVVSSSLTSVGTLSSLTVSGTTSITGTTTQTGAFNLAGASSPLQLAGSAGTSGQVLTSAGTGATPTWSNVLGGSNISFTNGTSTLAFGGVSGATASTIKQSDSTSNGTAPATITISGGNATTGDTNGGAITIQGGAGFRTTVNRSGGLVSILGAPSTFTQINGGDVLVAGGTNTNATNGIAGNVTVQGGDATANTVSSGGNLTLQGGRGGATGTGGYIRFITANPNTLVERFRIASNGEWQLASSAGTSGQVLTSNGAGSAPTWSGVSAGSLSGTTLASGVTTSSLTTVGTLSALNVSGASVMTGTYQARGALVTATTNSGVSLGQDSGFPGIVLNASGSAANQKLFRLYADSTNGQLVFSFVNDAFNSSGLWMTVSRSGTTASNITLTSTALNLAVGTGGLQLNGNAGTAGQVLTSNGASLAPTWQAAPGGAASTLTGTTLASNVVSSSLTTVGTLSALAVTGTTTQTGALNLAGASSPLQLAGSAGTAGQVLMSAGAGATPTWGAATAAANLPRATSISSAVVGRRVAVSTGQTITATTWAGGGSIAVGDIYSIYNDSSSPITLTAGAGLTMYKDGFATSVATITLAPRGTCSVWYNTVSEVVVSGSIV